MNELPAPLTPADCNLKNFPFMPLEVDKLRKSGLASNETPQACWAATLLWCASWHEVPAGSIPDDDRWIATQAGYAIRGKVDRAWKNVRHGALRGWVKCADGLLYHPVVSEKALESWIGKLVSSLAGNVGNAKRWGNVVDTVAIKAQIIDAANCLQAIAPQSEILKKSKVRDILTGSPPDSPPDGKNITPRQLDLSPPDRNREGEGEGDRELTKNKSSDTSNSVGAADTGKPDDSISKNRKVQIAALLRSLAIHPSTATHKLVVEWAKNPKITDVLLAAAVAKARKHNDAKHISPNYLAPIVVEQLKPKADNAWQKSEQATDAKARELGIQPGQYDSYPDLRAKISDELRRRKHAAQTEGATA